MIVPDMIPNSAKIEGIIMAVFFLVVFISSFLAIYQISGWRNLSKGYPENLLQNPSKKFTWQSARIGWVNFNNCLTFSCSLSGFAIKMPNYLSFGFAKTILIPWSDITWEKTSSWGLPHTSIKTTKLPNTKIIITQKQAEKIQKEQQKYSSIARPSNHENF